MEANYPISVGDELGNDAPAILDLGLKYRFLDFNFVKIGAGINASVFKKESVDNSNLQLFDFKETHWLIQPKAFAEFTIIIKKLHPSIGLGYTIYKSNYEGYFAGSSDLSKITAGGVNLGLGLSYDITKRFFLQVQCDYTRSIDRIEGEEFNYKNKDNLGFVKVGVGFRF
ncbi:outer membrane protein [Zobellia laminariae]|uniref:outer membrane protein n=1 Tax=Zobellia laminariae TaxID=248906 RepID=UPI0026F47AA4|nr:outer membrane beta-barrel protein [Zobellia laminariae]WKX78058.1 outer membrane beta-barrel protein [Zobellia laminariae]